MFRTILADGGIRYFNAQLGEFGLNAGTAPRGVGLPHLPNQRDEVAVEGGSSIACARFPTPEEAKAKAMPSDDGLGLEEDPGVWPLWPEAPQAHPQESIGGAEFRFVRLSFEDCQLMSERQVFKHEPGLMSKAGEQRAQERKNDIEHGEVNFGGLCRHIKVFKGARGFRYPHHPEQPVFAPQSRLLRRSVEQRNLVPEG